jgi:archaellum biogenesis protein FlaJ (TadC family)
VTLLIPIIFTLGSNVQTKDHAIEQLAHANVFQDMMVSLVKEPFVLTIAMIVEPVGQKKILRQKQEERTLLLGMQSNTSVVFAMLVIVVLLAIFKNAHPVAIRWMATGMKLVGIVLAEDYVIMEKEHAHVFLDFMGQNVNIKQLYIK